MAKKKQTKAEKLEIELNNAEKSLEVIDKITQEEEERKKEQEKSKRMEKRRLKNVEDKAEKIKDDLKNQLKKQEKNGKQFEDLVEDYIFFVKLKENLQNDINVRGLTYEVITGNGYKTEKNNESVKNIIKVNAQMLKILQDLELKSPEEGEGDDLL